MNTPRSKPPERYSAPKPDHDPAGTYLAGIRDDDAAKAIGKFLTGWPHVEERMVVIFGQLATITDFYLARQMFRTIVSQQLRIKIMRSLLQKTPIHRGKGLFFDKMIKEFEALNKVRNGYAHGLWFTGSDRNLYLEEETDVYGVFLNKRKVMPEELVGHLKRMADFLKRIDEHENNLLLAQTLLSSHQKPPPRGEFPSPPYSKRG